MRYSKNHPLWPVWDLQRQILKRDGKIDRHSDLLAYFEGVSLVENPDANYLLLNMVKTNLSIKMKELFQLEKVAYKKSNIPWNEKAWEFTRFPVSNQTPSGYNAKNIMENDGFVIMKDDVADNEIFLHDYDCDYILLLNEKYIEILRLIKNGYNSKTIEMKNSKNLIPAIIIAAGLIISAFIYAYAQRYEVRGSKS